MLLLIWSYVEGVGGLKLHLPQGSKTPTTWVHILFCLPNRSGSSRGLFNLTVPVFPCLSNGDNNGTKTLWGFNNTCPTKTLRKCLTRIKCSMFTFINEEWHESKSRKIWPLPVLGLTRKNIKNYYKPALRCDHHTTGHVGF